MAKGAVVKLRGQRDQLVDTLDILREMGSDLMRTEKDAKELSLRKFTTLIILYCIMICMGIVILHVFYYKFIYSPVS
jgi:hypothetical protein